ncbi:septum site-determining divIVA domain-containing protein [Streptococcus equi subsp. zooepidemicus]|uniref:Septum site-determining divIVA domain-containing protein n=1 Tax=Streptococcus equi subsp. zooepidemicus TaxID=40041 RepID=A0AAX2LJ16_STRSZ|nr:septum site-determining divIVA domain-containing protein [Streptococcus equi subsp. zooepidemicus]
MALTALEIKDKTFKTKFRGYSEEEVNEFLEIVVDDYEALVRKNRDNEAKIRELEEKLSYFDEMKESLSQSVILAQETAEKVKSSANAEATNLVSKATYDAQHLLDESKAKANQLLRDATDEAKRVAIETEELKRQTRVFHQRLVSAIESQLSLSNSPEWDELLQPTAVYLQNSDAAFKEVVKTVLNEDIPEADDSNSFDATRQFTPEELEELQRRVEESNKN